MEEYISKQQQIGRSAEVIYRSLASFDNFTPIAAGRVDDWKADADSCSFKFKGFTAHLRITEREEFSTIKVVSEDESPLSFTMWLQLKELAPNDTRMRIVVHAELNAMMRMMIGKKLQEGVDAVAAALAQGFR